VTFSLRTPSAAEAKRRHADASSQLKTFYDGLRGLQRPIQFTQEECVRLAGDLLRRWTSMEPELGMLDDGSERASAYHMLNTVVAGECLRWLYRGEPSGAPQGLALARPTQFHVDICMRSRSLRARAQDVTGGIFERGMLRQAVGRSGACETC
jgi:hypothetical protein